MIFWSQLKKELMALRGEALILIGAILLWFIFLHTRIAVWEPYLIIPLGWLPVVFVPLWIAWTSVHIYHQEWSANTHYLMLSLPVRAWRISLAKLAALFIGALGYVSVIAIGSLTLIARAEGLMGELGHVVASLPDGWLATSIVQFGGAVFMGCFIFAVVTQFAYLFSRLFERFQWLLMAWTWILSFWALDRFVDIVSPLLRWLPDVHVRAIEILNEEVMVQPTSIDGGSIGATVIFGILMVLLINVVIEQAVEA